uniref:HRDC domain-containing protein n=1 Tax=Aplanochytrium stocchinoi TaxID=215587 RepID=A0A7S3UZH7_9STRA|mmetsp:Transcript_5008/g.6522  ORF Transcript_5008/g.6522 Transcript_5008/m.6522 type:complete len:1117 (+) Transcript_5008:293-3643(+)|eukprot:CAMPEP_0204867746 /NCGR_PEP_ID=MMETSP1348-20121228/23999_1 /ASSEMBLY_ACC=CAM_ASM_000700 /TAXON_ID=215587 /ORGANISM="Aplanochytrium stocchinoi, Strain GSBS06" /LENGTH=1116 /DNA_ID=CAMNT_0052020333 /DNA_START=187 /DNA_END=3537 /DNA_ORIENTATION=-
MSTLKEVLGEREQVENLVDFEKNLYNALVHGTKASNSLPGDEEDYSYYASLPEFKDKIGNFRKRIVNLIYKFASRVDSSDELFKLHELIDADPADFETFEPVADVVDLLLENVDSYLDEARRHSDNLSGLEKSNPSINANAQVEVSKSELVRDVRAGLNGVITHDANIQRPQMNFDDAIDNSRSPFIPKLKHKVHAIVPLPENGLAPMLPEEKEGESRDSLYHNNDDLEPSSESLSLVEAHVRSLGVDLEKHTQPRYANPYETEIRHALASPPSWIFQKLEPTRFLELDKTPCTWINSVYQLKKLCNDLEEEIEISIDLENHSYRSFQGFVCLMQMSTRKADYIIDTLALRSHMHMLNRVFSNPAIVKVLHGSDSDVLWLQRDFGIYVVSLFDTGQAARVLGYPSAGLAFALQHHCKVKTNKALQLADWRIRPLSQDMLKYAREDTHYLLYIYDKMRNELLDNMFYSQSRDTREGSGDRNALLWKVLRKSASIALTCYEKDIFTQNSYKKLIERKNLNLSPQQQRVFARLYEWRDAVARTKDESVQYILPQRMLVRIVNELPRNVSGLERCCNPLPIAVREHTDQVLEAIKNGINDEVGDRILMNTRIGPGAPAATQQATNKNESVSDSVASTSNTEVGGKKQQTVSLGVNSQYSSFVPISSTSTTRVPNTVNTQKLSFAAATRAGLKQTANTDTSTAQQHFSDRRGTLRASDDSFRATPSPVLTTEQLYDTAGWQDIQTASVPLPNVKSENMIGFAGGNRTRGVQSNDLLRTAADTRAQIGEEALQGFGVVQQKTPFAAMATAMANSYNNGSQGKNINLSAVSSMDGDSIALGPDRKDTVAEDDVIDIDTPANADALESDDIPRSMAEIYRISNRNRKRNKEKKKIKEETTAAQEDSNDGDSKNASPNSSSDAGRKRQKNSGQSNGGSSKDAGTDEAIEFMRGIGWVNREEKPVANLVVQGAPAQPAHLAGASSPSDNSGDSLHENGVVHKGHGHGRQYQSGGGKQRGRHHKIPASPRRRQGNRGQGGNRQQQNPSNRSLAYAQVGSSGSYDNRTGGFSYSQAAASAAGVRWDGQANVNYHNQNQANRGGRGGRGRGGRSYNSNNQNRSISYTRS